MGIIVLIVEQFLITSDSLHALCSVTLPISIDVVALIYLFLRAVHSLFIESRPVNHLSDILPVAGRCPKKLYRGYNFLP